MDEALLGPLDEGSLEELRLQVEELRASRARVVGAADAQRRGIERDLHDGAQQRLVALAVNLQLARQFADSDPAALKTLLEEIRCDVQQALDDVRQLAWRVYPSLLLDRGLVEALRAAASDAAVSTRVEAPALGRYPSEVEATVYFCCSRRFRAQPSTLGRANERPSACGTSTARFASRCASTALTSSSGRGRPGSVADRLGALGGRLTIMSEAGQAACVSGTIPLGQ